MAISPDDARWVGAWWLGYIVAGIITLMSAVPFWFLPKSLPVPVEKHDSGCSVEHIRFIQDSPNMDHKFRQEELPNLRLMARGTVTYTPPSFSKVNLCKSVSILYLKKYFQNFENRKY